MEFALRQRIREALLRRPSPALLAFGEAIAARNGDRMACWGNLADHILERFERDEDRLALWRALVEVRDLRPLLLFLDLNRDRPGVLRAILQEPEALPAVIQCALVSMPETQPLLEPQPALHPAALEIVSGGETVRQRERALYEAHMASLKAQRAATFSSDAPETLPPQPNREAPEVPPIGDPR